MRAYFFTNMYLSSIQQGIQPLHVLAEMYNKYVSPDPGPEYFILDRWARDHKTVICLNAGYSDEIRKLIALFEDPRNPFPWAFFREGNDALDGALTSVGIVLPEEVYTLAKDFRELTAVEVAVRHQNVFSNKEMFDYVATLALQMNNYSLAK